MASKKKPKQESIESRKNKLPPMREKKSKKKGKAKKRPNKKEN